MLLTTTANTYNEDFAATVITKSSSENGLMKLDIIRFFPLKVSDDTKVLAATPTVNVNPH